MFGAFTKVQPTTSSSSCHACKVSKLSSVLQLQHRWTIPWALSWKTHQTYQPRLPKCSRCDRQRHCVLMSVVFFGVTSSLTIWQYGLLSIPYWTFRDYIYIYYRWNLVITFDYLSFRHTHIFVKPNSSSWCFIATQAVKHLWKTWICMCHLLCLYIIWRKWYSLSGLDILQGATMHMLCPVTQSLPRTWGLSMFTSRWQVHVYIIYII